MRYVSTRGAAPILDFQTVTLAGLASDGGLYVPESWPAFSHDAIAGMAGLSYVETAVRVCTPFVGASLTQAELREILTQAYAGFSHAAVAPLVQLDNRHWLLELFHGPTLAFKDVAMQALGGLFETFLGRTNGQVTIIGATSGDTGSAAINALAGRSGVEVFMLHPRGRVSDVQRRQMTTVLAPNIHNIAIEGNFDDAQALVKAMFNDRDFAGRFNLSAVNSINWARLLLQIVYYFYAAVRLGAPQTRVSFAVPTGNFGDVFAGYAARCMGLPMDRLIVATNQNDILHRALSTGDYSTGSVTATDAPSMDIQVSSNFERLLFDLGGRDGAATAAAMHGFETVRAMTIPADQVAVAATIFDSVAIDADTVPGLADVLGMERSDQWDLAGMAERNNGGWRQSRRARSSTVGRPIAAGANWTMPSAGATAGAPRSMSRSAPRLSVQTAPQPHGCGSESGMTKSRRRTA